MSAGLGPGAPLPFTTRRRMERAFAQPFGDVRVHTDDAAARVTARHDAAALTVGHDLAFAPQMYQPGTPRGDHLIAHELAHVVQQAGSGAVAQARALHSVSSEGAEQQAESAAQRVSSGLSAGVARGGFALSTRARVMRRSRALGAALPAPAASPAPGAGASPTRSEASPALTTRVSPAGGQLSGLGTFAPLRPAEVRDASPRGLRNAIIARATSAADQQKTPDQAQTAIAREPASPPTAMVAGAAPGATSGDPAGGEKAVEKGADKRRDQRGRGKRKPGEREHGGARDAGGAEREERGGRGAGQGRAGGGGLRRRSRRFGRIPGDRGAAAARGALTRLARRTDAQQHHEPAAQRIGDARLAVEPPPTEQLSRAQGSQVSTVAGEPAPQTDAAGANQSVEAEVDRLAPRNMTEMSDYDPAALRSHVGGVVGSQITAIQSSLGRVNAVPAAAPTVPARQQPPPQPAPHTAAPRSVAAVPPPVAETALDASEYREDADAAFEENGVSERARRNAAEGPLHEMRAQEQGIDQAVDNANSRVREREMAARNEATDELQAADQDAASEMAATRERAESRVSAQQDTTRTGEQTDRQTVTEQIEGLYNGTATFVNGQLSTLTQTTTQSFDTEQARYLEEFKSNTRRDIEAFKDDRYSTPVVGWGRWVKDRFVSINKLPRVKQIYKTNRDAYIANITRLINGLTAQADALIATCRMLITTTRAAIEALVASQPRRLLAEAQAAQARVNQQFSQLERQIEQTSQQVRNALETRRERAIEAVDQALAEIQAENASLVDRLVAFVQAIYNALKQFFRLMVRIEEIGIGTFLSRALDQAKRGVQYHLWNELKAAFQEWLMMKLSFLQPLLLLPSNFLEVLAQAAMNLVNLALEALPEALPALGVAAMTWLAVQLALKLIPGAGAIMAIIDAIRAAWGLIQSLIRAASAFYDFLLLVAGGGDGAVQFARALAHGIVAAVDALLTFLGVDSLLRRIARPIARPMGRILGRIRGRFRRRAGARSRRRRRERDEHRSRHRGDDHHRERSERSRARSDRRAEASRRRTRAERRASRSSTRADSRRATRDPNRRQSDDRRRRQREADRRNGERLQRAVAALRPRVAESLRNGVSETRFGLMLAWWRVRYRLSHLRLLGDGGIEAAINPRTVFDRARRVDPAELGRLLRPLLERAEQQYRGARTIASQQAVNDAAQRASQAQNLDPPGGQLSRGERAEALGRAPIPPSPDAPSQRVYVDIGGATARQRPHPTAGQAPVPSMTVVSLAGAGEATYPTLGTDLVAARRGGARARDIFAVLAARRADQAGVAAASGLGGMLQTLEGVAALDDLERGRNAALGTSNMVARRVGAAGGSNLDEQFGDQRNPVTRRSQRTSRVGASAPSTMVGAMNPRSQAELREQNSRIGRIFQRLERIALRARILKTPAGNLDRLARALDAWLRSRLARNGDPALLAARETELVLELQALLSSYD